MVLSLKGTVGTGEGGLGGSEDWNLRLMCSSHEVSNQRTKKEKRKGQCRHDFIFMMFCSFFLFFSFLTHPQFLTPLPNML